MKRREFLMASASLAGSILPAAAAAQLRPCPPPRLDVAGGQSGSTACVAGDAEADWLARIAGSGVVWYHDFRSDNEVNAFRWTQGYQSGNDPLAVGNSLAGNVRRLATDGPTGNCLEILRPTGTSDGSDWWRPFSPIVGGTTTGNGRGVGQNDPGANGTIPVRPYTATNGGGQIANWDPTGTTSGYYGFANGHSYDGPGYYFQVRVKMDPRRSTGNNVNLDVGKLFIIGRSDRSNVDQKIVVYSGHIQGGLNYFRMYSANFGDQSLDQHAPGVAVQGNQPNTQWGSVGDGLCRLDNSGGRLANCWYYPNPAKWVTLMWHVVPGTNGGANTLIEVWAAKPPATTFTKIWYQPNAELLYDSGHPTGHNAVHLSTYMNGQFGDEFYHRYAQLIFSKNSIPCPNDPVQRGEA